jgi:hypothetical protein
MAAIYDKSLRRNDFSGIVNKDNSKEDSTSDGKKGSKPSADAKAKADDSKAGADIGEIVNLMAGDANRVAMTSSAMYSTSSTEVCFSNPRFIACQGSPKWLRSI